jgi:outer membrane protein assembly factor BamB
MRLPEIMRLFVSVGVGCLSLFSLQVKASQRLLPDGFLRMAPYLDQQKPVGASDAAGWALSASRVLVGAARADEVVAIDFDTHRHLWSLPIQYGLSTRPLIADTWVFIATGDGSVYKIDLATGKPVWQATLPVFVQRPLLYDGQRLYGVSARQDVVALNATTGELVWTFESGLSPVLSMINASPLTRIDNALYYGTVVGELIKLDAATGALLGRHDPKIRVAPIKDMMGSLIAHHQDLYLCRYDGFVGAVRVAGESSSMSTVWEAQDGSYSGCTDLVAQGSTLYVGRAGGQLEKYDMLTNTLLWTQKLEQTVTQILVTTDDPFLYVTLIDGSVLAIEPEAGKVRNVQRVGSRLDAPPILTKQGLLVSTGLKNVYHFRRAL